jgi:ureidoglycolate lyase
LISLFVEELTEGAFAPFGRIVSPPESQPDAAGPGWRWWAEVATLTGDETEWGVGWLNLQPAEPRFDWAERHFKTEEAVIAAGADLLLYAGPPEHPEEPDRLCPLEDFRVFRVPAGHGVVLDRAVWHGAPLAVDGPTSALVVILQGTGQDDVTVVRFPDTPVDIAMSRTKASGGPPLDQAKMKTT